MQERKKQIEELESTLAELIKQRKEMQKQIYKLREKIKNMKAYDKYFRSVINHNQDRSGSTCQELFGKKHSDLSKDEMRAYNKIKQAERRARVKAERSEYVNDR
jgi:phage shock protein A